MADIILSTLNAKYVHAAFGLRYLHANLGELRPRACILEFDLQQRPHEVVEAWLSHHPRIVGLGVAIWNASESRQVVALLKRIRPEVVVVLGGPEVSHEIDQQEITRLADYVIAGEADRAFAELCRSLLAGERPEPRVVRPPTPDLAQVVLPYDLYTDSDLAHRVVYVEASRGCPFSCEFCLSSLDVPVRQFPLQPFLIELERLWQRGLRVFKFVDRTFNLDLETGTAILRFFLDRLAPGLFLHFEMIPDRLPPELRQLVRRFPPGTLQFEIGIQTFNPEVAQRISRRQDYARTTENLRFLRQETGVHLHADLIAGLPGESWESFGAGFDQLVALRPQEIQVGILKRLRGTPIIRHDVEWGMIYSPDPPYEILENRLIDFEAMQRLRRFARVWDLVGNSGNFLETTPRLWLGQRSPFESFLHWTDWLHRTLGRRHGIALERLAEALQAYLTGPLQQDPQAVTNALRRDFGRAGRRELPPFLREASRGTSRRSTGRRDRSRPRQRRHWETLTGNTAPPAATPASGLRPPD